MVSDEEFYNEFRKSVLGSCFLDKDEASNRISFMLFQFEMIPDRLHKKSPINQYAVFYKTLRGIKTNQTLL